MREVEQWGIFELRLNGPEGGNPFKDVWLAGEFQYGNRVVEPEGFYDGDGVYRIRFMPDRIGRWRYVTRSNRPELDGHAGEFVCVPPSPGNHGPVRVRNTYYFAYEDGTPFMPFGTTCYHWTHLFDEEHERKTLESLVRSPFNKVRMCLLPTRDMSPAMLAFAGSRPDDVDRTRFNPEFFRHLEKRLHDLMMIGVEADLILFHPYDKGHWGFDGMDEETDRFYLRYVIARLAAFRNVWWSLSNEYDFNPYKTEAHWDRLFRFIQRHDPYQHLRSIHNGTKMYERSSLYDFSKPWITHQSVQHWDPTLTTEWRNRFRKPVVVDEMSYEGNGPKRWGNITAEELVHRCWEVAARGGFPGHGEYFIGRKTLPWISFGGVMYGESPKRIAFLRRILEEGPPDWIEAAREGSYMLLYFGKRQHAYRDVELPADADYRVDLIDAWNMTVTPLAGTFRGRCRFELPERPYIALRVRRV